MKSNDESLPPLGSTVRIVSIGLSVWPQAEQFFGADCTLCAVFVTGDTQMVAVEHQTEGICCCFQAAMVRTPEQAAQEARDNAVKEMLAVWNAGFEGHVKDGLYALYDANYRQLSQP